MWTETTRPKYERSGLRYARDLTDAEWNVIGSLLLARKRLGRPRTTEMREVVNAILSMARTGCQWRLLPKDFPPRSTVQGYFYAWRGDGTLNRINHELLVAAREAEGRDASQFTGCDFTGALKDAGVAISMDGRGRCMDNIFIERLWRSLKYEAVYLHDLTDGFKAEQVIGEWIDFYNTERPHSALAG